MSEFEQILHRLPAAFRDEVARYWESFVAAAGQAGVEPPTGTLLEQMLRVWASSEFVARACIRDPTTLNDALVRGDLAAAYAAGDYAARLERLLADSADENQLGIALRRFRRWEMARIAWRDLAGLASLEETLGDLSELAEQLIDAALVRLHGWQCQRYGQPHAADGQPQRLVVLGMGKLGGRELNFSSDIDLIFTYPHQGQTDGARAVSNEEFFRRLGQRLSKLLAEPTAEGFVYRVDLRLRPFGDSGPLAMSFAAFEDYYQNHGRDWERYAMVKARVVAGDREAGERLLAGLRPFVYRRYLDYSAFASLRDMKVLIAQEMERKGMQGNIKLGPGGIREIEFIGQAFQLIYGGREPALRERSILKVLAMLGASGRLPATAVAELQRAYDFLRRVENRLQAWSDQQTHLLPDDERAKLRLAFAMGFTDWNAFGRELARHTAAVAQQFAGVFGGMAAAEPEATRADLAGLWQVRPGLAVAMAIFVLAFLGLPLAGGMGFFAKWYVLQAALQAKSPQTMLAVILVVSSAISAAYYLTIVSAMFMRPRPEGQAIPGGSPLVRGLITTAAVLLLAFGVYPAPVARLSRLAATSGNTRPSAPERESVRTIPLSTASAGPTAR